MKSQLSLVSEWSWRAGVSMLVGWGLSACGEGTTDAARSNAATVLLAEGSEGFGAAFAAGGKVGTATVLASDSQAQRGRRCEINLERSHALASCENYCEGSACPQAVARAAHLLDPDNEDAHCFVVGVDAGAVRLDCDGNEKRLLVPSGLAEAAPGDWRVAANLGVSPLLAVSAPSAGRAWFNASTLEAPVEIALGTEQLPEGFGADVALIRFGRDRFHSRLVAVAAPDAGQVWLIRSAFPSIDSPFRVGCLGERLRFGTRLGSGDIDGDGITDLLVADTESVTAFSGAALAMVSAEQADPACSLASLPGGAILASVSCASGGLTSGCEDAEFGASIIVSDLDGDTDGEIIIGAPRMMVSGKHSGAVLIYDAEGEDPHALTESLVDTSLDDGARFGASLGVVQGRNVDALVVGAPGRGAIFLAPCFSITRPELRPKICGGL